MTNETILGTSSGVLMVRQAGSHCEMDMFLVMWESAIQYQWISGWFDFFALGKGNNGCFECEFSGPHHKFAALPCADQKKTSIDRADLLWASLRWKQRHQLADCKLVCQDCTSQVRFTWHCESLWTILSYMIRPRSYSLFQDLCHDIVASAWSMLSKRQLSSKLLQAWRLLSVELVASRHASSAGQLRFGGAFVRNCGSSQFVSLNEGICCIMMYYAVTLFLSLLSVASLIKFFHVLLSFFPTIIWLRDA